MSDVNDAEYSGPNLKALRRIMAALIASAVLCFAICVTLIARAKPPEPSTPTHVRCACGGQCARIRAK